MTRIWIVLVCLFFVTLGTARIAAHCEINCDENVTCVHCYAAGCDPNVMRIEIQNPAAQIINTTVNDGDTTTNPVQNAMRLATGGTEYCQAGIKNNKVHPGDIYGCVSDAEWDPVTLPWECEVGG